MNIKSQITIAIVALLLMTWDAPAQEKPNQVQPPQVNQAQDMKGHDMSKMHGTSSKDGGMQGHNMAGMKNLSPGSMELHRVMAQGQEMPMPMSGDVDKDFATLMTMHHRQAIKMSDVLIQHGQNAELRALAQKMKAAQLVEIAKMAPYTK
ncbi:DUF305 domain-containing protein [Xanthomonas arboricola]|uniref:DUF305 domain-containing protein n=1 Tax=Xanthomonas arboricola TaxID=56448 RepID=UPI00069DD62B|nr:DUF305 domain-containing protein [Xanthomonas arboricola]AKU48440.1 hypothetical protein AKJ12_00475 [Xanthomonas arboricola pv. juglandis]